MSSYAACGNEKHWKKENRKEDEDEESAAESEEVDQLLSSYRKNPPKKRSSSSLRKLDSETAAVSNEAAGDEVVVVSIEHYEKPEMGPSDTAVNSLTSSADNWLPAASLCSSTSLLHDLLPHLAESDTNPIRDSASSTTPCPATFLSKTYTEPTSLSGLLRQMGSRLFAHYPSKVVIRHSKISPTPSFRCKLNDGDNAASQATVLTTTTTIPAPVDNASSDIGDNDDGSSPNLATSLPSPPVSAVRRFLDKEKQRRRPMVKTPLCKRCPHCRKTCSLRKVGGGSENEGDHSSSCDSSLNVCACRICMVLESVESTLSSPSNEIGRTDRNHLPASSTSTIDWSAFSNDEIAAGGDPTDGLLVPRHASFGGVSLDLGLFCNECNASNEGTVRKPREQLRSSSKMNEISSCCEPTVYQQKSREQGIQVNSSSMVSIATASSFGGPVCRICHSPGDKLEPLISPCRCLGTLKYVHASCLLHWLDISSRKLRRPPHCELCGYRYQRHKTMKFRRIQWPTCTRRDKMYHVLFLLSVLMMVACAAVTIVCFKADRGQTQRTPDENGVIKKATGGGAATVGSGGNSQVELSGQEVVTLVCGILFFCAFFVAMYVQVKAQTTVYKLCVRFWSMNQEWRVDEYRRERDAEYWRQRQEQQMRQRRASVQLSSGSMADATVHSPSFLQQQRSARSFSLSQSSTTSFRADMLAGID